ncbi:MAG TPA: hypothetical protein VFZ98_06985, partial [Vicinamibacterales bacterium]
MRSSSGLLAAVALCVAVPAFAQSSTQSGQSGTQSSTSTQSSTTPTLSDLARKAQEKKGAPAIRTFTNDDLKKV